ncbi:MAG TPA: hypothetical protein ENK49_07420 [Gammaproteobacteria bacterium]|nr:hypothetical protein [Gammaproteobacteria bacterium]
MLSAGETQTYTDPDTGLLSWQVREPGFSMQLLQLLPDYVRATYMARGLPPDLVETVAGYCVFGTIITNDSQHRLSYRVADWRYITSDGKAHRLKTKTQWVSEWKERGVAFRWSILPDDQTFEPGDWSQGFTTIALPPGSTFDLVYSWRYQGETREGKLEGLRCAPAALPDS